jgi:RNA-directed DNA polymerase
VLEFDIKGLFDNIDHDLLMKAVRKHTDNKWVILYIERWLGSAMQMPDGTCISRPKGVPQGGVISPVLSNLFLHYTFDMFMSRKFTQVKWCRYADDGVVHCKTEEEALHILDVLEKRFKECRLELHPEKTRIIYCKDGKRTKEYTNTCFTFLGYDFRRRRAANRKDSKCFLAFIPAVSKAALQSMHAKTRSYNIHRRTQDRLEDIAKEVNPVLRGWFNYYGHYTPSALKSFRWYLDRKLAAWARRKYKKLKGHRVRSGLFIQRIKEKNPNLFAQWKMEKAIWHA